MVFFNFTKYRWFYIFPAQMWWFFGIDSRGETSARMVGRPSGERLSFSGFPGRTKLLGAAVAPPQSFSNVLVPDVR
jgi:hypothetical protein